jgi:hypothetical protein
MSVIEQCTNIIFCVLMQKSPAELLTMLQQAYGDTVKKKSQMNDWHIRFHERRVSLDDNTRRSCLPTLKMEQMSIVWERL